MFDSASLAGLKYRFKKLLNISVQRDHIHVIFSHALNMPWTKVGHVTSRCCSPLISMVPRLFVSKSFYVIILNCFFINIEVPQFGKESTAHRLKNATELSQLQSAGSDSVDFQSVSKRASAKPERSCSRQRSCLKQLRLKPKQNFILNTNQKHFGSFSERHSKKSARELAGNRKQIFC
jgi:hypothetical protein